MEEKLKQYALLISLCHKLADIDSKMYLKAKPKNIDIKVWEHDLYTKHIINFIVLNGMENNEIEPDVLKSIIDS